MIIRNGVIIRITNFGDELVIPSEYEGQRITEIASDAFMYEHRTPRRLIFENGIETIQQAICACSVRSHAFEHCTNLKSIKLSEKMNQILSFAFTHCSQLTSITIPDNVRTLQQQCFSDCESLHTVKCSKKLENIEMKAFSNCCMLENIVLPDTIQTIDSMAFSGCRMLNIDVPINCKVSENAFEYNF